SGAHRFSHRLDGRLVLSAASVRLSRRSAYRQPDRRNAEGDGASVARLHHAPSRIPGDPFRRRTLEHAGSGELAHGMDLGETRLRARAPHLAWRLRALAETVRKGRESALLPILSNRKRGAHPGDDRHRLYGGREAILTY